MPPKPPSTVPLARPLGDALADSVVLARLGERIRESNARLEVVRGQLPEGLRAGVRAGPLDDEGWSLLAANAGVAAKLRQLLPRLEQALLEHGYTQRAIRLKVQAR